MSLEMIEQEIAALDDAKLRRLIAYAVVLQDRRSGTLAQELDRRRPGRPASEPRFGLWTRAFDAAGARNLFDGRALVNHA
jgi:hypothetical protein